MRFKVFLLFIFTLALFAGCSHEERKIWGRGEKPIVLVSVPSYNYFIKKIAQDTVEVEDLLPIGADPHSFEPNHRQIEVALNADLWFYIGEPIERKIMILLQQKNSNTTFCDLRQNIDLLPHDKKYLQQKDIYVWISPKRVKMQAKTIAAALQIKYPENAALYKKNLKILLEELSSLQKNMDDILQNSKGEAILVSHPAFTYLCDDYGIEQISLEQEGREVEPKELFSVLQRAREKGVKKVIAQSHHNNKGAQIMAKRLEVPLLTVDPYSPNYLENMIYIAKTIADD